MPSAAHTVIDATGARIRPPHVSFTVSVSGQTVSVDCSASYGLSAPIILSSWDFGDGATAIGVTQTHTYSGTGTFTITYTATQSDGGTASTTKTATIAATGSLGDSGGNGAQQSGAGIVAYTAGSGDFSTRVNTVGSSSYCSLPSGTYTFSDFAYDGGGTPPNQFWFGADITAKGIFGAGSNYTTIEMLPNTSTKASYVPAPGSGQPNQLQYVFSASNGFKVDGVKILGTPQGHLYEGLRFNAVANPTLTNSTIANIPGDDGTPPGETFGVNFYASTGTVTVTNVTVDGGGVGATAMGSNNSGATYNITNLYTHDHPYSAGWASWEHTGIMNFHGFVMRNGARAFNAERLVGTVNFYDPLWDDPKSGHFDVNPTYESGWAGGELNFYFSDASAWSAFIANRTNKKITAVSNPSSVSYGLSKTNVINVYIGGVLQTQSNYVTWTGI